MRVDGTSSRGLWPPDGGGLCPLALRGRRPFGPRVVDCRSAAMLIKSALRDLLSVSYVMISILRGEGGAVRHQRGRMHFPRPQGGCMVFAAKGGIKNGARRALYIPSGAILHNSRGRSPQPIREASAGPGQNPGSPGPEARRLPQPSPAGRQPSGIPVSAVPPTKAHDLKCRTQQKSTNHNS